MATQSFELKFLANLGDVLARVQGVAETVNRVATAGVDASRSLATTAEGVAGTAAALGRMGESATQSAAAVESATSTIETGQQKVAAATAEATAAVAEHGAQAEASAQKSGVLGTALERVGNFFVAVRTKVTGFLAPISSEIPGAVAHVATFAAEIAGMATGMGLAVTPMLALGHEFGNAGTVAAAAGAAFLIFSARAAGARAMVLLLSDAIGLTALKHWLFAGALGGVSAGLSAVAVQIAPLLVELAPLVLLVAALYAAWKLWDEGMAAADDRLANLKALEKLSHDGKEAAAALKLVQQAASDTGFKNSAMTQAYVTLAGLHDQALLTVDALKALGGMAVSAGKPVEDTAKKIAAVFRGIKQGGDEGEKATRAAIKVLQDEGVFADKARDRIDALQKAHADETKVLAVAREELRQYAGEAEKGLGTVSGEWARLKQQASSALGEMFSPLAELKTVLGGYLATAIHAVADALNGLRGIIRNELTADVRSFLDTIDEIIIAYHTFEAWMDRLHQLCDELETELDKLALQGLEGIKTALEGVRARVESWGSGFVTVINTVIGWVDTLIGKLQQVLGMESAVAAGAGANANHGATGGWGPEDAGATAPPKAAPPQLPDWLRPLQQDYTDAKAKLDAERAKEKADADKARADAFKRDEDRAVTPKTYDDEKEKKGGGGGKGGGGAAGRKKEVDEGAEAEKHYRQELDLTKESLALGEISSSQAQAQNTKTILAYIARLQDLQKTLSPTSDKFKELTVRIKDAQQNLAKQSAFGSMKANLIKLKNEWGDMATQMGNFATQTANTISTTIGSSITDLIFKTGDWRQSMLQAAKSIIGSLIQIGVQMVLSHTLGEWLKASGTATTVANNATVAASSTAAAVPATGATSGVNWVIGGIAAAAVIALLLGLMSGGFAEGGLIPGSPSRSDNRIARVATGEYVVNAPAVQFWGVDVLHAINSMAPAVRPPAFASGGLVGGGSSGGGSGWGTSSAGNGGSPTVNVGAPKVTLIQPDTRWAMQEAMRSAQGDAIILDAVARNADRMPFRR